MNGGEYPVWYEKLKNIYLQYYNIYLQNFFVFDVT